MDGGQAAGTGELRVRILLRRTHHESADGALRVGTVEQATQADQVRHAAILHLEVGEPPVPVALLDAVVVVRPVAIADAGLDRAAECQRYGRAGVATPIEAIAGGVPGLREDPAFTEAGILGQTDQVERARRALEARIARGPADPAVRADGTEARHQGPPWQQRTAGPGGGGAAATAVRLHRRPRRRHAGAGQTVERQVPGHAEFLPVADRA